MRAEAQRSTAKERFSCRARNGGAALRGGRFLSAYAWYQNGVDRRRCLPPIKFPGALDLSVIGETRRAWGGLRVGGIATVATAIGADLAARLLRQNKKQREGLALLVATALDVRDVNLMELAAALPRAAARLDMRYQWISRLLGNALIDTDEVIAPFAREVLARAGADGRTLVLIIDQSQINTEHQMVMVSLRVGGRALPLAWRVK